jgi:pyruvate/2-oxoglutarate dehydrogenase complex dihydrolipoamide acyltransferase (E2) component
MKVAIEMPKFAADAVDGRIEKWLKAVGDPVERSEPIVEIETDKALLELEATATGVLAEILHESGAEVPVGEAIAYIETEDASSTSL